MKHPHNSPWHTYKLKSKYSPSTFVAATAREETRDDNVGEMYEATAHELLADVKTPYAPWTRWAIDVKALED
jgi:hypothetical protein